MKNLNELEKSKGVLLFAFNTKTVNYVKIANQSSRLISKYLNLPITLVTDNLEFVDFDYDEIISMTPKSTNCRWVKDKGLEEWKNLDRCSVYDLSPYQTTFLFDVDYLIFDDNFKKLENLDFDYKILKTMKTPVREDSNSMGPNSLPMVWATGMVFNKTQQTKLFFEFIKRIQKHYTYYRSLFGIKDQNFRNDYAFSIANIILSGYSFDNRTFVPWPLITVEEDILDIESKNTFLTIRYKNSADVIVKQNLHIMDKTFLTSDKFKKLVDEVCDA